MSLTNNSDMVWAIYSESTAKVDTVSPAPTVTEFHTITDSLTPDRFMVPKETISINAARQVVEWAIHPEFSAAWTANAFLLKQITKTGESALKKALTGTSAVRRAVWACTKGVYDAGTAALKLTGYQQYDPAEQIATGFGILNSAGTCGTAWAAAAEREAGTTPRWALVVEETHIALAPAGELAERSSSLKSGVKTFLPLICKWVPRC
ncbi:hypothetical protein ACX80Q_02985 [Arthrobacter sp. HLT1-20]